MSYRKGRAYIGEDYTVYEDVKAIMLPHSCDEWVIGNAQEAQDLIDDLTELIPQLPKE